MPEIPVTIDATGNNKLDSTDEEESTIEGYEYVTIQGSGNLTLSGKDDIYCDSLTITGGVNVTATGMIYVGNSMTVSTTGTVNAVTIDTISLSHTGTGTINACVYDNWDPYKPVCDLTVYGNATYKDDHYDYNSISIPVGTTLTIPSGETMNFDVPDISAPGSIINNGIIQLNDTATDEDVHQLASALNITGTGVFLVPSTPEVYYTNSGIKMNVIDTSLDLSSGTEVTDQTGYSFTGNAQDGYILELNNLALTGYLTLPSNVPVTIQTNSQSVINGINFDNNYQGNVTFTGSEPLAINGYISGSGNNGDTITVQNGTSVTVNGNISIGGSGGAGGTVNVNGTGSSLIIVSDSSTGIYCDTVNVTNGANLNVTAGSRGIQALSGGVNVTGGSTLSAGCDYGVYIMGGKLIVDATSKLITNGSIAPFCIVDKANNTSSSTVLSLPGIPTGTEIASVVGNETGSDITYWSLIPTAGNLGVTDENNEPVTLIGAYKGLLIFEAPIVTPDGTTPSDDSTNPSPSDNGGTTPTDKTTAEDTTTSDDEKPVVSDIEKSPNTGDSMPYIPLIALVSFIVGTFAISLKKKITK